MKIGRIFSSVMLLLATVYPVHLVAESIYVCAIGCRCEIVYANDQMEVSLDTKSDASGGYVNFVNKKMGYVSIDTKTFDDLHVITDRDDAVFKGWYSFKGKSDRFDVANATNLICENSYISTNDIIKKAGQYGHCSLRSIFPKFVPLWSVATKVEPDGAGTVNVNSNLPPTNNKYEEGSEVTLTATPKDGYAFSCWKKDGSQVSTANPYTFPVGNTNATYTAVFEGKKYTLTVHPNGSEDNPAYYKGNPLEQDFIDQLIVGTTNLNSIGVASRVGYEFLGWFPREGGGTQIYDATGYNCKCKYWTEGYPSGTFCGSDDLSVYAGWKLTTSKVTLDNQGGDGGLESVQATFGQLMPTIAEGDLPKKVGYRFAGYYSESEGKGTRYYDEKGTTTSEWDGQLLTLYAHWTEIRCKVTFDANRPSGSCMVSLSTNATEVVPGVPFGTALATAYCEPAFYDFAGWRDKDGNEVTAESIVPEGEEDITLYAHWTTNNYYIAFDGREPTSGEMSVREFKFDTPAALTKNAFEKTGYEFAGWSTNIGAAVTLSDGAVVSNLLATTKNETNTLYAVWKGHAYEVQFFGNGGLGEMWPQAFRYGAPQNLSSNQFVREGYSFAGWATDPTNGVRFADGASVTDLTTVAGGRVALFAKWRSNRAVSELSIAADCDNLNLTTNEVGWTVEEYKSDEEKVGQNNLYLKAWDKKNYEDPYPELYAEISGPGVLTFQYKGQSSYKDNVLELHWEEKGVQQLKRCELTNSWLTCVWTNASESACAVRWVFADRLPIYGDYALLDNIKWVPDHAPTNWVGVTFRLNDGTPSPADVYENRTCQAGQPIGELPKLSDRGEQLKFKGWAEAPSGGRVIDANWKVPDRDVQLYAKWDDGSHPEPTPDDAVTVSAAKVAGDKFTIEFESSAVFDYLLMTNGDLSVKSWGELEHWQGDGNKHTFKPAVDPAQPQLFYRIDTIQRQ